MWCASACLLLQRKYKSLIYFYLEEVIIKAMSTSDFFLGFIFWSVKKYKFWHVGVFSFIKIRSLPKFWGYSASSYYSWDLTSYIFSEFSCIRGWHKIYLPVNYIFMFKNKLLASWKRQCRFIGRVYKRMSTRERLLVP